jgi:hypothetical protein
VPSLTQEMAGTPTARWYRLVRSERWSASWGDRQRCFDVLAGVLASQRVVGGRSRCRNQPEIGPPSLSDVARQVHAAPATLYKWWGGAQGIQTISRWAGPDPAIKPGAAFVAEAKVVSFWPYRSGCLQIADVFDMTPAEAVRAYYRTLAAWAGDVPTLAACRPSGPPGCVGEDLAVIAGQARHVSTSEAAGTTGRLTALAGDVVARVLEDASLTPLGALNTIRDDVVQLLSAPPDPISSRVHEVLAELADRLLHRADGEAVMTPGQEQQIQSELDVLRFLLRAPARLPDGGPGLAEGTGP